MELDPRLNSLLDRGPAGLDDLMLALAPGGDHGGPRPWLPPLPAMTAAHAELWLGVVDAIEPLVSSPDMITRHKALKVLARCPVPGAGVLARGFLADEMTMFVTFASDTLARSGAEGALADLEGLLVHPAGDVRFRAAGNLGVLGDPAALPALRRVVQGGELDPLVVRWAATSIGDLGGEADRVFLLACAESADDALAREGIRAGLEALGVVRDDLHISPEFAGAARRAPGGDPAAIDWLLDHYADRKLGDAARLVLTALPTEQLVVVALRLLGGSRRARFAAADVLGAAGVTRAAESLRTIRDQDYDPALILAAGTALMRLGDPEADAVFARRWGSFDPRDRAAEAQQALVLQAPAPEGLIRTLLADPCALVVGVGAELIRREARGELGALLGEALELERQRVEGLAPPRDREENEPAMTSSALSSAFHAGSEVRALLPLQVQAGAAALERAGNADPHVLAARSMLHAMAGLGPSVASPAIEAFMTSTSPLLRLDALKLWSAVHGRLPPHSFANDADMTVRALWGSLR